MGKAFRFVFCIFLLTSLFSFNAGAVDVPTIVASFEGYKGQLAKDTSKEVNINSLNLSSIATIHRVTNVITFKINEDAAITLPGKFQATITYKIYFQNASGTLDSLVNQKLSIDYDSSGTYNLRKSFSFRGGYKVTVKIVNVQVSQSNVLPALVLTNELNAKVDYIFVCNSPTTRVSGVGYDIQLSQPDELHVNWVKMNGADEYDLEWTYIDSTVLNSFGSGSSYNSQLIFEYNSTRVSISDPLSYKIPLLYDFGGVLFFRIRAVQNKVNGKRIEAQWSSDVAGGLGMYSFFGHERNFNWQATTSFAEEGKRKSVIQYFDGTLRARQTVTKDNSTGTTVVAETLYDFQGRPAIQVLPAPTLNTVIQYAQNFNRKNSTTEYDKLEYDSIAIGAAYCAVAAPAMDSTFGAAQYYSSSNPLSTSGFHQYIPNAGGYAFTETQYTQDNTGRIEKQGGVGASHRLNSGHATSYSYGLPSQTELDGLFGTEAGDYTHYQKNMVRDANGQYSVSYVDMNGKTIATALAGDSIPSLDAISTYLNRRITEALITPASNYTDGLTMTASNGLLVPKAGSHRFVYSLLPDSIKLANCRPSNICYDCIYDLEITITGDCNNGTFGGQPIILKRSNLSLLPLDTLCNAPVAFPGVDTTINLSEGSYLVTKKLTVSTKAFEYYRDSVFLVKNACKTKAQFIQQALDSIIAQSKCNITCDTCLALVGSWSSFHSKFMQENGYSPADTASHRQEAVNAFNDALEVCSSLCNDKGDDKDIRLAMLADVSAPSGQYADTENSADPFSIFFINGTPGVPGYVPHFQDPALVYLDENGKPDTLYNAAGQPVLPQSLDPEAFADQFKSSWAEALLKYHPEYCKLQKYDLYKDSHAWDKRFDGIDTYKAANDSGFINPVKVAGTYKFKLANSVIDPLFNKQYMIGGVYIDTMMRDSILNYRQSGGKTLSMWAMATMAAKCSDNNLSCLSTYSANSISFDSATLCTGELDMAWRSFKQLYLTAKQGILRKLLNGCPISVPSNRQARFVDPYAVPGNSFSNSNSTATQISQEVQNTAGQEYKNNCEAYANQWLRQLSTCPSYDTTSLKNSVLPKLIAVCIKGSDATHPYGSSSIAPDSTNTFNSFEAVLNWYNDSLSLSTGSRTICNAYLIPVPKPYNQVVSYGNLPIWSKPDSCTCAKITQLFDDYQLNNSHYSDFSAYMKAVHKTTIAQSALDSLRQLCSGVITCKYIVNPIQLPPALQCGITSACVNCLQVRDAYAAFKTQFPGATPSLQDGDDSVKQAINIVFANFMNTQFGFGYSAFEYLTFMKDCKIGTTAYADTLWQRIYDFKNYYGVVSQGQVWRNWKLAAHTFSLIQAANVLLKARRTPDFPQLPPGYAIRPYNTQFINKMKSVIKHPSVPGDSTFQTVVPYELKEMSTGYTFTNLENNQVYPSDFATGVASLAELSKKYFAVVMHDENTYFHNIWRNVLSGSAYASYGFTTPDAKYVPDASHGNGASVGSTWGNDIQSFAFYKLGASVINSTTYVAYHKDSVNIPGVAWNNYGDRTIHHRTIKSIRNPRFATNFLPLANMNNFSYTSTGIKVTLDLMDGSQSDAFIFSTYDNGYTKFKEAIDSNLYNPNCKAAFQYFFNQREGTNYTIGQIDALYQSNGILFDYCTTKADTTKLLCGKSKPVFEEFTTDYNNCTENAELADRLGSEMYIAYIDSLKGAFDAVYLAKCLSAYKNESFTVEKPVSEYHYTLYYYDQAGNLVKTVPPQGVDNRMYDTTFLQNVKTYRNNGTVSTPTHTLTTDYRYNTLNQVVAQKSPDGGESRFWYDRLGRLAVSQNAEQAFNNSYSYTLYDGIGRITEVGQVISATQSMTDAASRNATSLANWINQYTREQITRTVYDVPNVDIEPELKAKNLRNRVTYTSYTQTNGEVYRSATFYSYDIHGNVDTLLQDYRYGTMASELNRFKRLVYRYDLISGKVNHVAYQPNQRDALYHRYEYDAENKLVEVYTSTDSLYWERDAKYKYYKHGPLARVELGQQKVQGLDYAYTLQGWLKGVNGTVLYNGSTDMGGDGVAGSAEKSTARDAFGFTLHYFDGDYQAIGKPERLKGTQAIGARIQSLARYSPLYNGNISAMAVNIGRLNEPAVYNYRYDQLNRLKKMQFFRAAGAPSSLQEIWDGTLTRDGSYDEAIEYDGNGNILKYVRHGKAAHRLQMDSMTYRYASGKNQLNYIRDDVDASYYAVDIDSQTDSTNYLYDRIGNLIKDKQGQVDQIQWTVYGKIKSIIKYGGTAPVGVVRKIDYSYDASGNRISKTVVKTTTGADVSTTSWYVRDASGNVMSVYKLDPTDSHLYLSEQHLYGSSRIGMLYPNKDLEAAAPAQVAIGTLGYADTTAWVRGRKVYELSNHLGNVLATITDKKIGVPLPGNSSLIDYYMADVTTAQDYYPFGMLMPGRSGYAVTGGWATTSGTSSSSSASPSVLSISSRSGNVPVEYVASESVEFVTGFESAWGDSFEAYVGDGSTSGNGGGSGGNGNGLASGGYRYGFNGKENDNEVKGEGNQQDYGMRIYDPRIGKFLSVDPITKDYPELTPYQFASNTPIVGNDLDGLELKLCNFYYKLEINSGKAKLTFQSYESHMVHEGGFLGWKNLLMGQGHEHQYWAVWNGKVTGGSGWVPFNSLEELQASADFTAKLLNGDKEAIAEQERRDMGITVAYAVLSKGLSETGNMFKPNASKAPSSTVNKQVASANNGKLGGRSIIVDENLSPKLVTELQNKGYNVKTFKNGTLDADIITYAEKNNAIVLTNNIKDFNKWGITTFKVSENMKKSSEVGNVVKAIENINGKATTSKSVIAPGTNVSLAENK